ncbi:L,D-transpeptidase [Streptomyces sp. TRM S81-3]|uniref:L,D-transpeptidase n=1 Tax=Streptomyces griseicoloratus TaxID=2752516 RepID=A0A926QQU9_9ACTN|nr:L,D-transpeptidase [Streptomyces griseicoloratus]MBD0420758.1 L,D-transpeptidase [Streptomyces griseicoloratus]
MSTNGSGSRLRGTVAAGAAATILTLAPTVAAHGPAEAVAGAAAPATTLVFDKNPGDPTNSKLSVYRGKKLWATYRAGSGLGVEDDCARARGWMPNGNWKIKLKTRTYNGKVIKGYAVYLQDMKCSKGTVTRTEMFIHSEMNRDGSAGKPEARHWNDPGDYESNGCVKLNPTDIKKMFRLLDRIGWPTHLRVVS